MTKTSLIKRAAALLFAFILVVSMIPATVFADEECKITSVDDFLKFASDCTSDGYSAGMKFTLECDISLSGVDFEPIPVFNGTFDGKSHTISGYAITDPYGYTGLFGKIGKDGVVTKLNVVAEYAPGTDCDNIGGIAGYNEGAIVECTFEGNIVGGKKIGGIVGKNGTGGRVQDCKTKGKYIGASYLGGVVGDNNGTVDSCTNEAEIIIDYNIPGFSLSDLSIASIEDIESLTNIAKLNLIRDIGGIAGFSSGMILSCVNNGNIDGDGTAYNVGGIVGRNAGYISDCENTASVCGKKDVGGIVGQAEPYMVLTSFDSITEIGKQLTELQTLIENTIKHLGDNTSAVGKDLKALGDSVKNTNAIVESITGEATEYGTEIIGEINRFATVFSDTLKKVAVITADLSDAFHGFNAAISNIKDAINDVKQTRNVADEAYNKAVEALDEFDAMASDAKAAADRITAGLKTMATAVTVKDWDAYYKAIDTLNEAIEDESVALAAMEGAFEALPETLEWTGLFTYEIQHEFAVIASALAQVSEAALKIRISKISLENNKTFDYLKFSDGVLEVIFGLKDIVASFDHISICMDKIAESVITAAEISTLMKDAGEKIGEAFFSFADGFVGISNAFDDTAAILEWLGDVDPMQIAIPSDEIMGLVNSLFDNIGSLGTNVISISSSVAELSEDLISDISKINTKIKQIAESAYTALNEGASIIDPYADKSDEDIDELTYGKVYNSINTGDITADSNVGGIAGNMGIDYSMDIEGDESIFDALKLGTYDCKAVLQNCTNKGNIKGTSDNVGSIVGNMSIGRVVSCYGYGSATSENGGYVGGIAGNADTAIVDSFAKCVLSGNSYIGGIAGSAAMISGCVSMVAVNKAARYVGAICGDENGKFENNMFVSDKLGGINRISYDGMATSVTYEELSTLTDLPEEFKTLNISFIANGITVKTENVAYGSDYPKESFPAVPEKEGFAGKWDIDGVKNMNFDVVVSALYEPLATSIESTAKRQDGKSVFLVQGNFDTSSEFEVTANNEPGINEFGVKVIEAWDINIPDDGNECHSFRWSVPEGKDIDKLSVYAKKNGEWKKINTSVVGSYIGFDICTQVESLALAEGSFINLTTIIIAAAILLALIILIIVIVVVTRKKKF